MNTTNENQTTGIPQHILDFCDRVYPRTLGSAYDSNRAHLIAKRMAIESPTLPPSMLSIESILSMLKSPAPTHNEPTTNTQPPSNESAINPQQTHDESATNAQQNPQQNSQPIANEPTSVPRNFKRRGPDSIIDSLPPETQQAIANLLEQYSLDRVAFILSKPGPHGPALEIDRYVLHRFQRRLRREQALTRAAENKSFVDDLLNNPHASDDQLSAAIRHIFQTRLLEEINDPTRSLADVLKALQTSERFRQTDIAARRIATNKGAPVN